MFLGKQIKRGCINIAAASLLFAIMIGEAVWAAETTILTAGVVERNICRIRASFSDGSQKRGMGFVVREAGGSIYVATANELLTDVFTGKRSTRVLVKVGAGSWDRAANVIDIVDISDDDVVVLRMPTPPGYNWDRSYCGKYAIRNDAVRIYGWRGQGGCESVDGFIKNVTYESITVESNKLNMLDNRDTIRGGPVTSGSNIVGILIYDGGNNVNAMSIRKLKDLLYDKWRLSEEELSDFPFFAFGINIGLILPLGMTPSPQGLSFFVGNVSAGVLSEFGLLSPVSLRLEVNYSRCQSGVQDINEISYQFKNELLGIRFAPIYYFNKNLMFGEYYMFGGYSYFHHSPKLRVDDQSWEALSAFNNEQLVYSDYAHAFDLGIGIYRINLGKVRFGAELGIAYTTSRYVGLNLEDVPPDDNNDWIVSLHYHIAPIKRMGNAALKIIK